MNYIRHQLRDRRRRGVVLLLFTLMMFLVVLPAAGLAIDAGILYAIKAKLQTATDGAALAGARSLSRGIGEVQQNNIATTTAERFFDANIQNGWLGLSVPTRVVTFPAAPPKTKRVHVETSVNAPTYFMRVLGVDHVTVRASAESSRRDVNLILVLDRSASMGTACGPMKTAAADFVRSFVDGRDRIGLITFGTTYRSDFEPAMDFRTRGAGGDVLTLINNISCVGGTNAGSAYWLAYQKLVALNEPGSLNVILFFTDGRPTAVHMPALTILAASACTDKVTARNGVITYAGAGAGARAWGLFLGVETAVPGAVPNPDYRSIANAANCNWSTAPPNPPFTDVNLDVNGLGDNNAATLLDVHGISLIGWLPLTPVAGRISIAPGVNSETNVRNSATNVLDNAASLVRTQSAASGLDVMTYSIGLGNQIDQVLLNRIANTAASPIHDNTKPEGTFVLAADASQLQQAFAQLASDILRLSM